MGLAECGCLCGPNAPRILMKAVKQFDFGADGEASIRIQELMADTFGLFMWPSAHLLSRFVWEKRELFRERLVIELGAGTGLPGLLAAHRAVGAAHVYITDRAEGLQVLENCRETVQLNDIPESLCTVVGVTWGHFSPPLLALPAPDIILGADCFYHEGDFERLLVTVTYLLSKKTAPSRAVFYTVVQDRGSGPIACQLERWGLMATEVEVPGLEGEEGDDDGSLHLIAITLREVQDNKGGRHDIEMIQQSGSVSRKGRPP